MNSSPLAEHTDDTATRSSLPASLLQPLLASVRATGDDFDVGGASLRHVSEQLTRAEKNLPHFLREAMESVERAAQPRGGSVLHENGFRKVSLFKDPVTSMQVRLNFWPAGTEDGSIHDHRWNFLSLVVCGTLEHSVYEATPSTAAGAASMVELSDADASLRKSVGASAGVEVRELHRVVMPRGTLYSLDAGSFHMIRCRQDAVTLMVTGRPLRAFTRVIRTSPAAASRRALADDECLGALRTLATSPRSS